MGVNFTARVKALQRDLDAYDKKRIKAYQTAVKVEVYRLSQEFKKNVQEGSPGGKN